MHACLFDLDGTLIESKQIWYNLLNNCRMYFGYRELIYDEWQSTFGQSMEMNRQRYFPNQTQQQINDYCDRHYIDQIQYLQVFERSADILKYCSNKYNNNVVCVTNCPRLITQVILPRTDFSQYFTHVVCSRDVVNYDVSQLYTHMDNSRHTSSGIDTADLHDINMSIHTNGISAHNNQHNNNTELKYSLKPKKSPDTLLHACKLLDIHPSEAYFIGDTSHDMEAAAAAGCIGIGINVDGGKYKINDIGELTTII